MASFSWVLICVAFLGSEAVAQCTPPVFSEPPEYAVGTEPTSVATGDFNGDGIADLAVANNSSGNISILLGDGVGGFGPPMNVTLTLGPFRIAVSDFNKDGKADVVVGHFFGGGPISVLFGDGSGRFSSTTTISVPGQSNVAVGDFNGDTNPDIAAGIYFSEVRVLLGDGHGGFSARIVPGTDDFTTSIVAADFNADGLTDFAFTGADSGDWKVSFVRGDSAGNFSVKSSMRLGQAPKAIAAADFNGDGSPDVAITGQHSEPTLSILLNNGAASFSAPAVIGTVQEPRSLATADFNGDGKTDIAVAGASNNSFQVFLGNGFGQFPSSFTTLYSTGKSPVSIVAGDFNADGKIDLVAAVGFVPPYTATTGKTVAVLLGVGTGGFNSSGVFAASPCITVSDVTVTEGDTGTRNADFIVSLSEASAQTVRVNYSLKGVTATEGADYTPVLGRLVFQPGETSKIVSVPIVGEAVNEVNETFELNLASPAHASIGDATGSGTITDNDPLPVIFINDITHPEGGPFFTREFTVTLSAPSGKNVTVRYATADGTAIAGTFTEINDYAPVSGTLTIPAGQSTATIGVLVAGDTTFEPDETFFLNLSNPTDATIGDAQGQATITNDDPVPGLTVDSLFVTEGDTGSSIATFNVRLSNATSQTVTVNYATSDGTAVAGSDYTAVAGSLTFAPLETSKSINVPIINDTVDEVDETINLNISDAVNATITRAQGTSVLRDNDGPTISINDISVAEGNSETTIARFTVSLSAQSVQSVRVNFSTHDGTAVLDSDYEPRFNSSLTIPAGATSGTLSVALYGDTTYEPDETFFVNLTSALNGTIADGSGIGTILNDDQPAPGGLVQFSAATFQQNEGDGRATITVTRTGDTNGTATVDYRTTDTDTFAVGCADAVNNAGGAYARCDFAATIGKLSFAAGEINKTITVPIINDGHVEGAETFQLQLSSVTGTTLGTQNVATITITDNDAAGAPNPIITASPADYPFFVRQQYLDFLSREPEPGEPWTAVLNRCPNVHTPPSAVTDCDRIAVSGAFFRSPENSIKGFYVFRFYKVAFNRLPEYREIVADMSFVAGQTEAEVYDRKAQLAAAFAARPEFTNAYSSKTNAEYVTALLGRYQLTQVTTPDPATPDGTGKVTLTSAALTNGLNAGTLTRAQVLRAVADSDEVAAVEYNSAFVASQYYGYLRRTPEESGYRAWLKVINEDPNNVRIMVNGFMNSTEYRLRFGPIQ
jgi:hypothetical protein